MKSGNPAPIDDLKLIIEAKRHTASHTVDVVSEATAWLKSALDGAGVDFNYASCEDRDHYGYAAFTVIRSYRGDRVVLDLKVAEINDRPYVFAEVRAIGKYDGTLFPYFGDLKSDEHRTLLLHYVADYMLSTEA